MREFLYDEAFNRKILESPRRRHPSVAPGQARPGDGRA